MTSTQTDKMATTQQKKTYFVVVPIEGSPYIHSEVPNDENEEWKVMREIVGGYIEYTPHGYYTVHPLFARENKKWDIVRQLLNCKDVKCYGNENGMRECPPNMGLVITPKFSMGECPHSWGNEVLIVPEKVLTALKVSVDDLKEECCGCGEELGKEFKEIDTLTKICKKCDEEEED